MWFLRILKSVLGCVLFYGVLCVVLQLRDVSAAVGDYTHEWAVKIDGGDEQAEAVASEQNYELVDKVFHDVYVFRHKRLAKRSLRPSVHYHRELHQHPKVSWAQQQKVLRRNKRDYQSLQDLSSGDMFSGMGLYRPDAHPPTAILNDPQWPQMWYLNRGMGLDMKVQEAWAEGVTGRGVVATILDDGLEKGHPDIIRNYDPEASYDVNNRDLDPAPRYDLIDTNRHGTRCAGEVAADANNSVCAVGVAYEASIGGVRMLDGDVTDAVEARSLALNPQHIDIYSASWGPDDDGKTVDGPGELATRAFIEGINNGRNGLGSIFIWASGNGGRAHDNCNCDGYTNAIWTLSISSATERGNVPWYSEACSSTLATTYSSGSTGERKIITTDLHHECTTSHTGTSASAPLAAGIVALALQVNRNMTWRDMQHIVVRTARPENLDTTDWQTNGVGRRVSHRFGYGLMDAHAMVQLARNWTTVAPQRSCEVQAPHDDKLIPQKSYVTLKLEVSECPGVQHLEHVQAMVSLSADRRGDLEIYLISPAGTKSTLLAQRPHDDSRAGFHSWPFMTVHMWGEKPLGYWVLEIHNNGHFYTNGITLLRQWSLILHGSWTVPPAAPPPPHRSRPPHIHQHSTQQQRRQHQQQQQHRLHQTLHRDQFQPPQSQHLPNNAYNNIKDNANNSTGSYDNVGSAMSPNNNWRFTHNINTNMGGVSSSTSQEGTKNTNMNKSLTSLSSPGSATNDSHAGSHSTDKVEMRGFTLVLHGTEVAPGEPSPNNNYQKFPPTISSAGNHISHQDLTHSTTGVREDGGGVKDTNTQRHNPYDDAGHHSGRAGGDGSLDTSIDHHGKAHAGLDDVGHSAASRPTPVSFNTMMAQNPSVKKAGVDDHAIVEGSAKGTRDHPVPVKMTAPDAGPLPAGCLFADPDSSACIECQSGLLLHHEYCVSSCPDGHYSSRVPAPPRASYNSTMLRARRHLATPSLEQARHDPSSGTTINSRAEELQPRLLTVCSRCHYSCRQCLDSREDQCTVCWPELILSEQTEGAGVCNSVSLFEALSRNPAQCCSTPAIIMITVGCAVLITTLCIALVVHCCSPTDINKGGDTVSGVGSTLISDGVGKLKEIRNGLYTKRPKKSSKVEASYRKLSDDTEKLVSSSRPFYDYSSSEEEIL